MNHALVRECRGQLSGPGRWVLTGDWRRGGGGHVVTEDPEDPPELIDLVGEKEVITVDDVVDVIHEEAEEDDFEYSTFVISRRKNCKQI